MKPQRQSILAEAADAASQYLTAKREHLSLVTEVRVKRQARRMALTAAALAFIQAGVLVFLFWLSVAVHERGIPPWLIATLGGALLTGAGGLMAVSAWQLTSSAWNLAARKSDGDDRERKQNLSVR